jgi:hypothetical protein
MARTHTPTPKTPGKKRPAAKLRGGWYPVTLLLPPDLVPVIDAIAAQESRSRVKQIEVALRQFVQSYQRRDAA